jgi:hypothetical protein
MKRIILFLSTLTFVGVFTTQAFAQDDQSIWNAPWKFRVNLYGWLPDAPAAISVDGKNVVDVPEELDTILDSLEAAAMFELEVQKGRLVLFANNVYYKGDYDKNFTGSITALPREYELEEEVWAIKYAVGYELGPWNWSKSDDSQTMTLIPWAGAFYFHDDWSLEVKPASVPFGGKVTGTYEFNTPMVGLASRVELSDRWYLLLSYGNGGWGEDDVDEIYDFIFDVGYRFKMWDVSSKAYVGYRYLHFEWEDSQDVGLVLTCKGPFVGIGWEF